MPILFYCNSFLSIAPYIRTMGLCRSLLNDFSIDYIRAGAPFQFNLDSPRFKQINLPLLTVDDRRRLTPPPGATLEQTLENRLSFVLKELSPYYLCFITELFPFSSLPFTYEIRTLIRYVKHCNPACKIICCIRDIMDKRKDQESKETLEILKAHYDYIFVHADPSIITLRESFPYSEEISDKIIYTGFIPNGSLIEAVQREKKILLSNATGFIGDELIQAAAETAILFPDYEFHVVLGPLTSKKLILYLKDLQTKPGYNRLHISGLLANFTSALQQSALSISLAGYTLIDVVHTKTPSLTYPLYYDDQFQRAQKFSEHGLVKILSKEDLEPIKMAKHIREALKSKSPSININMNGIENSRKEIIKIAC